MKTENIDTGYVKITAFSEIRTVGELKSIISELPNEMPFGFLNQPEQILEHRIYKNGLESLVFQESEKRNDRTILVIGTGSIPSLGILEKLNEIKLNNVGTIVIEKEQSPMLENQILNSIKIDEPFIPKSKHQKKGHERPYKFHR